MLNILIIEDNLSDYKLMSSLLEKRNYSIFHAQDWFAGQQLLQERKYHLILLDWELPQISGIDVLATLKKMPLIKNIPVIFVTGRNEGKFVQKAIRGGAADYVLKPIDALILIEKVDFLLSQIEEKWELTSLVNQKEPVAQVQLQFTVLGLSEIGIEFLSSVDLPQGMPLSLSFPELRSRGLESLNIRVSSCHTKDDLFICRGSLVGMKEVDLQKIRLYLRSLQVESQT